VQDFLWGREGREGREGRWVTGCGVRSGLWNPGGRTQHKSKTKKMGNTDGMTRARPYRNCLSPAFHAHQARSWHPQQQDSKLNQAGCHRVTETRSFGLGDCALHPGFAA
jgi:hypothetical protein